MGKLKMGNSGKLEKFWEKCDRKRRRKKKVNLELSLRELKILKFLKIGEFFQPARFIPSCTLIRQSTNLTLHRAYRLEFKLA